jgi:hypothetical protein
MQHSSCRVKVSAATNSIPHKHTTRCHDNMTDRPTLPSGDTLHSQLTLYTASPLTHTSQYNMTNIPNYQSTRHHRLHIRHNKRGRHTKIHYVTTNNMAAARHTSFTTTKIHGVTMQHGRHTKIPIYTATSLAHTSRYNMADTQKYISSRLTTWRTRDTLYTQIPIYTASPLAHTSQYTMTDTTK